MASNNNSAPQSVVQKVESRVDQLLADHRRLSEQNRDLMELRDNLQATKREMQERIATLERELALSELKGGLVAATKNNSRARAYVNRLMREVDHCITLISSPGGNLEEGVKGEGDEMSSGENGSEMSGGESGGEV